LVAFYSNPGCAGGYISAKYVTKVESLADGWKRQTLLDFPAPAGTQSASVFLQNAVSSPSDTSAGVNFDDAGFGPAGTFYTPPSSPNLLTNPDFDYDLGNWQVPAGSGSSYTVWNGSGGYGGGGQAVMVAGSQGDRAGVSQCVNIDAQAIDFEVFSKIDYTGGGANTGTASVSSFSAPDCVDYIGNTVAPVVSTDAEGWRRHALFNYVLPAATRSAMVFFSVGVQGAYDTSIGLRADHFGFGAAGTFISDVLFKNGFE
jgi:hypothetical protein